MRLAASQAQGFALFHTPGAARAACEMLSHLSFDERTHIRCEIARKNMYYNNDGHSAGGGGGAPGAMAFRPQLRPDLFGDLLSSLRKARSIAYHILPLYTMHSFLFLIHPQAAATAVATLPAARPPAAAPRAATHPTNAPRPAHRGQARALRRLLCIWCFSGSCFPYRVLRVAGLQ